MVSVGVGVSRQVKPHRSHVLAIAGRSQELIHALLVSIRGLVRQEGIEFSGGRREAGKIKGHAAQQCRLIRFG